MFTYTRRTITTFGRLRSSWIGKPGGPICSLLWYFEARNGFFEGFRAKIVVLKNSLCVGTYRFLCLGYSCPNEIENARG